jgi:hypothetical protein
LAAAALQPKSRVCAARRRGGPLEKAQPRAAKATPRRGENQLPEKTVRAGAARRRGGPREKAQPRAALAMPLRGEIQLLEKTVRGAGASRAPVEGAPPQHPGEAVSQGAVFAVERVRRLRKTRPSLKAV